MRENCIARSTVLAPPHALATCTREPISDGLGEQISAMRCGPTLVSATLRRNSVVLPLGGYMRQGVVFALIPMLVLLSCVDVVKTADTSPSVAVDTDTDTDADADADSDSDTDSDTDSVDQAPQAIDDEVNVDEGGALVIDVLVNDTDPNDDIDATTVSIIDPPLVGAASVSEDGTVEYTHDGSEPVVENFTYTVDDATGLTSNIAQVTITIDPQNDAPIAVDDIASATEGALTVLDLTANDTDPDDGLDFSSVVTLDAPSMWMERSTTSMMGRTSSTTDLLTSSAISPARPRTSRR